MESNFVAFDNDAAILSSTTRRTKCTTTQRIHRRIFRRRRTL